MNPSSSRVQEVPNLCFPEPEQPLKEHGHPVSWSQWMDEMEDRLRFYCLHYDSAQERLETKVLERFVL